MCFRNKGNLLLHLSINSLGRPTVACVKKQPMLTCQKLNRPTDVLDTAILYGYWCTVWLLMYCRATDVLYGYWCIVWILMYCMDTDVLYGYWCTVWLLMYCMVTDVLYGYWCTVGLLMNCMATDVLYGYGYTGPTVSLGCGVHCYHYRILPHEGSREPFSLHHNVIHQHIDRVQSLTCK